MSVWRFYGIGFAFLFGVFLATVTPFGVWFALALSVSAGAIFVYAVFERHRGAGVGTYVCAGFVILGCAAGVIRTDIALAELSEPVLDERIGTDMEIVGVVQGERDERSEHTNLTIQAKRIGVDEESIPVDAGVRVTAPRQPVYKYGDRVRLNGTLEEPDAFETDTGRVFEYDEFLAKDGISYTMYYPKIETIESGAGNPVISGIFDIKQQFLHRIEQVLQEPHSALAGGILLGTKQSLGDRLEKMFRDTGLIHVVVLSGYNVTIVAVALATFLRWVRLGARTQTIAGLVGIAVFAVMVGLGATVVRASILAALVIIARSVGARFNIHRALLIAAVGMVVVSPLVLMFDPSFQLSFVATLGLVYITPIIERFFQWIPRGGGLFEISTATVATQLAVMPLLIYMTGSFSLVAVPVNLLALPMIAPAMAAAFVTGLVALISRVVAMPFGVIAFLMLGYILLVVKVFAALPFAHVTIPPFPVWITCAIYAGAIAALGRYYYRHGYQLSEVMEKKM